MPQASTSFRPNYDIFSSMNTSQSPSQSSTPAPGGRPQSIISSPATATPSPALDPFASLVSAGSRQASPLPSGKASNSQPPAGSLLDLMGSEPAPPANSRTKAREEDEWNFASSLPESNALPSMNRVQVLNSTLRIEFMARRHPQQTQQIHLVALFSNGSNQPLSELHFQVAVEKVSIFSPPLPRG